MRFSKSLTIFLFLLVAFVQSAFASCGSATCPLHYHRYLTSGLLQLRLHQEYIDQDRIFVGTSPSVVGAIRYHHDEVRTINRISVLQARLGITDRIGLRVDAPFIARDHSHIHHHGGEDQLETWSFSGFGDLEVGGLFVILLPESQDEPFLSVSAAVKFPTGLTTAANSSREKAEASIQPGSGSFDGTLGFVLSQSFGSILSASGEYVSMSVTVSLTHGLNGRGTDGWKFGDVTFAHVSTAYRIVEDVGILLQMNGRFQKKADPGDSGEPAENTGGTRLYLSPGLELHLARGVSIFGYYQLPLYQNLNGIQQTSAGNLQVGISADLFLFPAI